MMTGKEISINGHWSTTIGHETGTISSQITTMLH